MAVMNGRDQVAKFLLESGSEGTSDIIMRMFTLLSTARFAYTRLEADVRQAMSPKLEVIIQQFEDGVDTDDIKFMPRYTEAIMLPTIMSLY